MSQIDPRGGVSIFQISLKFKKVSNIRWGRGGGSSLFGTLSQIFLFLNYDASPKLGRCLRLVYWEPGSRDPPLLASLKWHGIVYTSVMFGELRFGHEGYKNYRNTPIKKNAAKRSRQHAERKDNGNIPSTVCASSMSKSLDPSPI